MNNILIYKIGKDNCSSCVAFDAMKNRIQNMCPYPILSINNKNIENIEGMTLNIDGHTVTVPKFSHYMTNFPVFFIYDGDKFVDKFVFKLRGELSLNTFIEKVNTIVNKYVANKY